MPPSFALQAHRQVAGCAVGGHRLATRSRAAHPPACTRHVARGCPLRAAADPARGLLSRATTLRAWTHDARRLRGSPAGREPPGPSALAPAGHRIAGRTGKSRPASPRFPHPPLPRRFPPAAWSETGGAYTAGLERGGWGHGRGGAATQASGVRGRTAQRGEAAQGVGVDLHDEAGHRARGEVRNARHRAAL